MWDKWLRLPLLVRIGIVVLILGLILLAVWFIDRRLFWIALTGLGLITLLGVGYMGARTFLARSRGKAFAGDLLSNNMSTSSSVSDPAHRAKLDELRQVFMQGIKQFSDAGKDLYSLPWYLVCGEPGSGKTETIRHSGVGFPPGLIDEMQGIGGTINMHWWFTNHAIILDTAGKLLFQEAPPGATSEWVEFLTLLKSHRPNCPVNGLLLVLPAESLLKDSPEEIQRKAGRITSQLDRIQSVLDVRFPVYVMVTKCDLIHGFREFFADVKDPELQHQMLGWSNPDPLDVPFRPSLVSAHLEEVASSLRQRRLALLADPVPATAGSKRLDEVDALFTLPASVEAIAPALKQYLDVLFVVGEWTQKPLFLRGIYFTSSLIEGSALDVELASALGVPVDHLPDGKTWERDRSFFLRDIFLSKIFHERGLVTRASNTSALLRKRQIIMSAVAAVGILSLLLFSWLSYSTLRNSIMAERDYWRAASENWNGLTWEPIVSRSSVPGSHQFLYRGDNEVDVGGREMKIVDFHDELRKMVSHDIDVPLIYKPVEKMVIGANRNRRHAQRVLFESSVVRPSINATRAALSDPSFAWDDKSAGEMALLMKLEGLIYLPFKSGERPTIDGASFFGTTLAPLTKDGKVPTALPGIFDWTFSAENARPEDWPGAWLSAGKSFTENRPLANGWDAFSLTVRNLRAEQRVGIEQIQNTRVAVEDFLSKERALLNDVATQPRPEGWSQRLMDDLEKLTASRSTVDELIARTAALEGMPSTLFTLQEAYRSLFEYTRGRHKTVAKVLSNEITAFKPMMDQAEKQGGAVADFTLFRDVQRRLVDIEKAIDDAVMEANAQSEQAAIPKLDADAMVPAAGTTDRVYAYRYGVYRDAIAQVHIKLINDTALLGRLGEAYAKQEKTIVGLNERALKYEGSMRTEFVRAVGILQNWADKEAPVALAEAYAYEFEQLLATRAGFPVIRTAGAMNQDQLRYLYGEMLKVSVDPKVDEVPLLARKTYERAQIRASRVAAFVKAIAKPTGETNGVKISVASLNDQRRIIESLNTDRPFTQVFAGNIFRTVRLGDRTVRTQVATHTELVTQPLARGLADLEFFSGADAKPRADARTTFAPTWAPVRLLLQKSIRVPEEDGRLWLCPLEIVDGGIKLYFVITLQFDNPLPEIDLWP